MPGPADLVDRNRRFRLAGLFVHRAGEMQQVMRGAGCNLPADGRVGVGVGEMIGRRCRIRMRKHVVGETEGERRLADTFRPFDQDRVMALARTVAARQKILGGMMAVEMRIARRRHGALQNAGGFLAHPTDSALLFWVKLSSRTSGSTIAKIFEAISSSDRSASTTWQRSGSASAISR